MSQKNFLDQNRVDSMIDAALMQDVGLVPILHGMAEKGEEPIDALAVFLVGGVDPWHLNFSDDESDEEWDTLPCTSGQWKFFMGRCREATKNAQYKIKISDKDALQRFARIGQWPDRIPLNYQVKDHLFMEMGWEAAWAYSWWKDQETCRRFLEKGCPPICEITYLNGSWNIASGLIDGLESGLIEKPQDWVPFVLSYDRWYVGPGNASTGMLCHKVGMHSTVGGMSDKELQNLAVSWEGAARELGKRHVPLLLPSVQKHWAWKAGVYETIPTCGLEKDAERYVLSNEKVERYCLSTEYSYGYRYETVPMNPSDPFGPRKNKFLFLTGMEEFPSPPSFEEVEQYVLKG